ncbi:hypothetical protein PG985_014681 [Apiospora marii]
MDSRYEQLMLVSVLPHMMIVHKILTLNEQTWSGRLPNNWSKSIWVPLADPFFGRHTWSLSITTPFVFGNAADTIILISSLWHPLEGPNQDWPLALCDATSLDSENDLEVTDYVTTTNNREHCMVYNREGHRWWYLSHQEVTEAFIFRQYDSSLGLSSGIPHASFLNPNSKQNDPRHSIEIVMALIKDIGER